MLFVTISDLNSFAVHGRDIVIVALTELVHLFDQVISLGCQFLKFVVHRNFGLAVLSFLGAKSIQLLIQFPEPPSRGIVIVFQTAEIISLAQQIRVNRFGLTLYLPAQLFLFSQLGQQGVLFLFETIEFIAQFVVEISLVLKVILHVAVDDILEASDLVELVLEVVCKGFLLADLLRYIALFMGSFLEFAQNHVESFHQANFLALQHMELVSNLRLGILNLSIKTEIVVRRSLSWLQGGVYDVVRVEARSNL